MLTKLDSSGENQGQLDFHHHHHHHEIGLKIVVMSRPGGHWVLDKGVGRCSCYFVFVLDVDDDAYGRETMMIMMMTTCSQHVAYYFVCVPNHESDRDGN